MEAMKVMEVTIELVYNSKVEVESVADLLNSPHQAETDELVRRINNMLSDKLPPDSFRFVDCVRDHSSKRFATLTVMTSQADDPKGVLCESVIILVDNWIHSNLYKNMFMIASGNDEKIHFGW